MRFLADESCDFAVVRVLRTAGHDVTAVTEISPGIEDEVVIDLAISGNRILLTEDKDFGQLVYAHMRTTGGVIFTRFPSRVRRSLPGVVNGLVSKFGAQLAGHFVVVQPGRIRIGKNPKE